MGEVNPGVKAGFFGGAIYGFIIFIFVILSLTVIVPLSELSRLISSITGVLISESALIVFITIGAVVILTITIVLGILFGLLYNWICEKVDYEWSVLIALLVGSLFGLFLGLTINLPLSRVTILVFTLIFSPTYSFTLYLTHRRAVIRFNAGWMSELDDVDKKILLVVGAHGCKYWGIKEKTNIEDENLRVRLQNLEVKEYIDIRFDNKYVLTRKGKTVLRKLLEATTS